MTAKIFHQVVGSASTSGAVTATVCSYTLPAATTVRLQARVTARSSTGDSATMSSGGLAKTVAGVSTVVGSVFSIGTAQSDASLATATMTLDISGSDARVRVTGVALVDIDWQGILQVDVQ